MSESSEAAEQVVRMMLSGGEVAIRLSGSALKNSAALLLALARNHKKVAGKMRLTRMLRETRDVRQFQMTPEQFHMFKRIAKKKKLLYAVVQDRHHPYGMVDVLLPISEIERANMVFEEIRYAPPNAKHQEAEERQEQPPKKEHRSRSVSRDIGDSFSIAPEQERTMHERPSIEQRLRENKAILEQQAPARQRVKVRGRER